MTWTQTEPFQGILLFDTQGPGGAIQFNKQLQVLQGGLVVNAGGASIAGGLNFQTGGLLIASGGATIAGTLDVTTGGLIVASGVASIQSSLVVRQFLNVGVLPFALGQWTIQTDKNTSAPVAASQPQGGFYQNTGVVLGSSAQGYGMLNHGAIESTVDASSSYWGYATDLYDDSGATASLGVYGAFYAKQSASLVTGVQYAFLADGMTKAAASNYGIVTGSGANLLGDVLNITQGGLIVASAGASIQGVVNLMNGGLVVGSGGASVAGRINLNTGIIVASGGASIVGGAAIQQGGVIVGSGGASMGGITQFSGALVSGNYAGAAAVTATSLGGVNATVNSITGNDTAGAVYWQGAGTPAAGAQVVVKFGTAYAAAPKVVIGPAGPSGAAVFVSAVSASSFQVSDALVPPAAGASMGFYYWVVG